MVIVDRSLSPGQAVNAAVCVSAATAPAVPGLLGPCGPDASDHWPVLEKASVKRVFMVAIVGHGPKHDATLAAYQQAARKNAAQDKLGKAHVEVVSFDSVTDPEEIPLDLVTLVSQQQVRRHRECRQNHYCSTTLTKLS